MEDELRLFLLLGGSVFIIGVLAHGIWKIRKNSKPVEKQRLEPRQWNDSLEGESNDDNDATSQQDGYDEHGVGSVRVIIGKNSYHGDFVDGDGFETDDEQALPDNYRNDESTGGDTSTFTDDADRQSLASNRAQSGDDNSAYSQSSLANANSVNIEQKEVNTQEQRSTLYGSVITNPKPHLQGQSRSSSDTTSVQNDNIADFPEPPGFLLKESEELPETTKNSAEPDTANAIDRQGAQSSAGATKAENVERCEASGNEDGIDISADASKKYQRSEVPKATSTLYVDATIEDSSENNATETKSVESPFAASSGSQRVEPTFSSATRNKDENERVASNQDEVTADRKRFSKPKRGKSAVRQREEPNFGDDQMRIDFDDNESQSAKQTSSNTSSEAAPQEVLVLNVRAKSDSPISGAALLPMLLTLGFKFGEQDIFHRHVNANGKGPVLFSLANMFKPGVFDIDNLENFDTQGISLFMILPIEGDPHQVFNMMHNAARKLADEFDAQVLDGRRSVLTKQGLQQYVEKIREFERKRMISRS